MQQRSDSEAGYVHSSFCDNHALHLVNTRSVGGVGGRCSMLCTSTDYLDVAYRRLKNCQLDV
jgi:hypothetical protein